MKRLSQLREMSAEQQAVNYTDAVPEKIKNLDLHRQLQLARWNKNLAEAARLQDLIDGYDEVN